jgi:hypothetical protein
MPSATDLYFPVGDARYEAGFIPKVTLTPIPSLWGHTAGCRAQPGGQEIPQREDRRLPGGAHALNVVIVISRVW